MIGQYTWYQWLLYFYIYCFFGWIFESCYVSMRKKKWVNRGFLHGPFLPIYGSGAVMMLFVSEPFKENLVLTYFAGVVGATVLELLTGMVMESLFKIKYWDYSNQKFNFRGYICLSSSVAWGFLTIIMNEGIHPAILRLLVLVPKMWMDSLLAIVSACVFVDVCLSVRDAIDLRNVLIGIENMQHEALRLKHRADVVIAVMDQEWHDYMESHPAVERMDEVAREMELLFGRMRKLLALPDKLPEKQRAELLDVRERFLAIREKSQHLKARSRGGIRMLVRGNPSMASARYAQALDTLKTFLKERK